MKPKEYFGLCTGYIISPTDACEYIKRNKNRLSYGFIVIMLGLLAAADIAFVELTNYPLSTVNLRSQNIFLYVAVPVIALLVWIVSGYAVSTITDGSAKFKEFAAASVCSVLPFIVLSLPLVGVSYLLEINQSGFFSVLTGGIILWIVLLLFYSFMTLNEYGFSKAVGITLLVLLVMFAICFIAFILYSMTNQLIDFIKQFIMELQLLGM